VTRRLTEEGDLVVVPPWRGGAPVKEGQRRWLGELLRGAGILPDLLTGKDKQR
jgi:hypothetical protein